MRSLVRKFPDRFILSSGAPLAVEIDPHANIPRGYTARRSYCNPFYSWVDACKQCNFIRLRLVAAQE
jgi:hypothetical protein